MFLTRCKIPIGLTDHPGEAQAVRLHRGEFDILAQLTVLMTDARGIEKQIHPAQVANKLLQPLCGILRRHIDTRCRRSTKVLQHRLPAGSHTDRPSFADQQSGHLAADARRRSYDNRPFHLLNAQSNVIS